MLPQMATLKDQLYRFEITDYVPVLCWAHGAESLKITRSGTMADGLTVTVSLEALKRFQDVAELNEKQRYLLAGMLAYRCGRCGGDQVSRIFEAGLNTVFAGTAKLQADGKPTHLSNVSFGRIFRTCQAPECRTRQLSKSVSRCTCCTMLHHVHRKDLADVLRAGGCRPLPVACSSPHAFCLHVKENNKKWLATT